MKFTFTFDIYITFTFLLVEALVTGERKHRCSVGVADPVLPFYGQNSSLIAEGK